MTNKDFDFEMIGKQTPYRTPDDFFDDVQQKVMKRTVLKQRRSFMIKRTWLAVCTMAALLAGILFAPSFFSNESRDINSDEIISSIEGLSSSDIWVVGQSNSSDKVDKWILNLSDEELEELVSLSENDVFLD